MCVLCRFDYVATKTGSIVVPSCGLDSVPSDLLVYLSLQTARKHVSHLSNSPVYLGRSRTAFDLSMSELSAGSLTSFLGMFDNMPRWKVKQAYSDWALSPCTFPLASCRSLPVFILISISLFLQLRVCPLYPLSLYTPSRTSILQSVGRFMRCCQ